MKTVTAKGDRKLSVKIKKNLMLEMEPREERKSNANLKRAHSEAAIFNEKEPKQMEQVERFRGYSTVRVLNERSQKDSAKLPKIS